MKNILLMVEDCEATTVASPVVQKTIELARAFSSKVWLLHILPPPRDAPYSIDDAKFRKEVAGELHHEHQYLQELARCMRDRDIDADSLLMRGNEVETLLYESERLHSDLIVVGCYEHGRLTAALLGATGENLLGRCARTVMFVPG